MFLRVVIKRSSKAHQDCGLLAPRKCTGGGGGGLCAPNATVHLGAWGVGEEYIKGECGTWISPKGDCLCAWPRQAIGFPEGIHSLGLNLLSLTGRNSAGEVLRFGLIVNSAPFPLHL